MISFIDTHAHYYDDAFNEDRIELLNRIHNEDGVSKILNIGCSLDSCKRVIALAEELDFLYVAVGIHPEECDNLPDDWLEQVEEFGKHTKVVAIGEIGLDYHYEGYDAEFQKKIFRQQLELAVKLNLPAVIHVRDATEDSLEILRDFSTLRGVMHCFSGSAETAKEIIKMGLHISFTGVLTFKNAKKPLSALKEVPINRLLTETDCPYMAPEPFRGKRCDSSMIIRVIEKIAAEKGMTPEEVATQTSFNAEQLFGI